MGHIKKLYQDCLVGAEGSSTDEVYPVTSTRAVYDENNDSLQTILDDLYEVKELIPAVTSVTSSGTTTIPAFFKLSDIIRVNGVIVSIYNEDENSNKTEVYLITASRDIELDEYDVNIIHLGGSGPASYPINFYKAKLSSTPQVQVLGITYNSPLERDRILVNTLSCNTIEPYTYSSSTPPTEITVISPIDYLSTSGGSIDGDVSISGDLSTNDLSVNQNLNITGVLATDSIVPNTSGLDNIDFGNYRIINIATPIQPNDATTKVYVDSVEDSVTEYINNKLSDYMPKSGDRFSGPVIFEDGASFESPISLDEVQIHGLADPTSDTDAANKQYVDTNLETKQDIIPALSATISLGTKYLAIPISNNNYSFEIVITKKVPQRLSDPSKYIITKYLYCGKGNDVSTREIICIGDDVVSEWKFGLKAGSGKEYIRLKLTGTGELSVYVSSFNGNPVAAELVDSFSINPTYPSVSAVVKSVAFQE